MPITAFSRHHQKEMDVEQLLRSAGYDVLGDPDFTAVPAEWRKWVGETVECSCCGVLGANIVARAKSKRTGSAVGQPHFRFSTSTGQNPHDPLCDYLDEKRPAGQDYLVNFSQDQSVLTRQVRELVCRGIEQGIFTQADIRGMRRWFMDYKNQNKFLLDVSPELLDWCVAMFETRSYLVHPFTPELGQLPGYNWQQAAALTWAQRNANVIDFSRNNWTHFQRRVMDKPRRLAKSKSGQLVFDPSPLQPKYDSTIALARFVSSYLPSVQGQAASPFVAPHIGSRTSSATNALLAFSSLMLYLSEWQIDAAVTKFVRLRTGPPAKNDLEGNLIGINPFHDYETWHMLWVAREVGRIRQNSAPVPQQIDEIVAELKLQHQSWLAHQAVSMPA